MLIMVLEKLIKIIEMFSLEKGILIFKLKLVNLINFLEENFCVLRVVINGSDIIVKVIKKNII